jgi:hypothetical protein
MARLRTLPSRHAILGVALLLMLGALAAPGLAADLTQAPRTYAADIAPTQAVCAGVPTEFTLTLTNTSTQQQLGSADIRPGFTVTSASPGTLAANGTTIQLRNLALPPLAKVEVTFTGAPTASSTVSLTVKQANNFNGPPGNDFARLTGTQEPAVTVTACQLAFVTEPDDAVAGSPIPGVDGTSGPRVGVVDPDGGSVAAAGVPVTIAVATNPVGGALTGTTTVSTGDDGIAAFPDLRIDKAGLGYQLGASSAGFVSATSVTFNVFGETCTEGQLCESSIGAPGDDLQLFASGTAGAGGGRLFASIGPSEGTGCEDLGFNRIPDEATVVGVGLEGKLVTLRVSKEADQFQPQNGVAQYQICAQPIEPLSKPADQPQFVDRFGDPVFAGEWGYLPDCGSGANTNPAPCVASRVKSNAGEPLITVRWGSGFRFR